MPSPFSLGPPLAAPAFAPIRRAMMLRAGKWDAQLGDRSILADRPLFLAAEAWRQLSEWARVLTTETLELERAALADPLAWKALGLPGSRHPLATGTRVMRFDFHYTTEGWRLSEVNSDVPGGYAEATEFPALMAEHYPGAAPCGAPGERWARCIAEAAGGGAIALLAAPGFVEDQQVTSYLAGRLGGIVAQPRQLRWEGGRAFLEARRLSAIVRFYQGEWLLRERGGLRLLTPCETPICNPGLALLSESKRLPLLWDRLGVPVPIWRSLLPECREPSEVPWQSDGGWVLKKAYSNTGDTIRSVAWHAPRAGEVRPGEWVAQRRFEIVPVEGLYPCVGVYTVEGEVAGAYGRISPNPVIDYLAQDIAILVRAEP